MFHSSMNLLTRHRIELSEGEVKLAIVEFIANRRPMQCPLDVAGDAAEVLKNLGTRPFTVIVEQQETRNGPSGEMVDVTVVKFDVDRRTP